MITLLITVIAATVAYLWIFLYCHAHQEPRGRTKSHGEDVFEEVLFQYRPLEIKNGEIRLLHLPRRTSNQSVHLPTIPDHQQQYCCTLKYTSLSNAPPYQALSYTWGGTEPTCQIMIDDQPFWIPHNLAAAIHHLTGKQPLVMWIDAICINQKDNTEKSWQVQQMRQVYERADSVIVWLGEEVVGSRQVLEDLVALEEARGFLAQPKSNISTSLSDFASLDEKSTTLKRLERTLFGLPIMSKPEIFANIPTSNVINRFATNSLSELRVMSDLLKRPWWGRIWVVQELAVAKQVHFACGYDMISGECFRHFLEHWDLIMVGYTPILLDHRPWALFEVRERLRLKNPLKLKDLLQVSSKSQLRASDPRDQIFGLFGLAEDEKQLGLQVDYGQSCDDLYIRIAKYLLLDGRDLWILSFCRYLPSRGSLLPSWVPDWSAQPGVVPIIQAGKGAITGNSSPFRAWQGSSPCIDIIEQIPPRLALGGIKVDKVIAVGNIRPTASHNDLSDERRQIILAWLRAVTEDLSRAEGIYKSEEQRKIAIWRTLIADQWLGTKFGWERAQPWVENLYNRLIINESRFSTETEVESDFKKAGEQAKSEQYFANMMEITNGRRPFRTEKGYIGIGPQYVSAGDVIVILFGADVPFILRETVHVPLTLIGEAYVHGIMYGEFLRGDKRHSQYQTFELG